jgi:hypothetical protein
MGIIEDLTGGTNNNNNKKSNKKTYSIFVQFDEDAPLILKTNIDNNKPFIFQLDVLDHRTIQIECPITKKVVKIFTEND